MVVIVGGSVLEVSGLKLQLDLEECMRVLVCCVLCLVKDLGRRIRWDCSFVIRSWGRWGKCG
jgi:hypothetical protein